MTGDELKAIAVRLFGEKGWQSALSLHLGIDRTQVWRYFTTGRIPGPVAACLRCWDKNGGPC